MSEIEIDDSSKSNELNQNNGSLVDIKIEPHEETADNGNIEELADDKVMHIKEEVTNDEADAHADVNVTIDIKCEYLDTTENVYDQELVVDEGVCKIKLEVDTSWKSFEDAKGGDGGRVPSEVLRATLDDEGLKNKTQCCYKQLKDSAPMTVIPRPVKRETLFSHKNVSGSTSINGNIGVNLNAVNPGKTRSESLPHHKELRVVLEDVMLPSSKYNTHDSLVQLTAQLSKDKHTVDSSIHPTIKNKNILMDPEKISDLVSVSTDVNDGKPLLICDLCNKQFNIKKSLRRHIRKHSEMYSCTFCSFKTRYRNYINEHINGVHTKRTVFKCDYCSYATHFKNLLTLHINKKHAASDSYNCTKCGNVTYRGDKLSDEIDAKHKDVNAFNCSHCNFKTFRQNRRHTVLPKAKESVYNCTSCSYKSGDKWNCIRHVNAKHSKTEVYNCPLCSYKAYHKMTLAKHVNVKHTKANVYKCSRCSYKAYNEYNLKVHVNVKHTKTTVYDCSHCSYKAYNKCTLSKHVSAKHTRTVFVCSYCTFESNYQTSLTRHLNSMHPELKQ